MKLVFTNGCFDILHRGHCELLQQARDLGDFLIVGINSDESVAALKGPTRPVNCLADRVVVLKSLRWVDQVIPFDELDPVKLVKYLKPHVLVKGPGYSRENMPEAQAAEAWGGEVVILGGPDISTTKIIEKIGHA